MDYSTLTSLSSYACTVDGEMAHVVHYLTGKDSTETLVNKNNRRKYVVFSFSLPLQRLVAKNPLKMYRQFLALQHASRRMICSSARRQVENKVPEKQKLFQVPDS
ncbi:hypothetical protein ANANG_G00118400 [Anguilla anguilla]|uniref:Uncharacterized protein n=1 Tax=Anguilla anguilla TaxID=7936 RepID=A0A9D3S1D1_ANGAN|nr:hypothetical protein ANANG_G00118400 [Anguilla anguilla]